MTALLIVAAWCACAFPVAVLFCKCAARNESAPLFTDSPDGSEETA